MRHLKLPVACLCATLMSASAWSQLAPAGFTGAINSPTADVLAPGTVSGNWTNSNPEKLRAFSGSGSFGSANMGFGILPGLEVVGRLAYEGDLFCVYGDVSCQAGIRDLSAGVKYQLPLRFGWDTRLAFGAVDIGGAATNFRSYYAVATASVGAMDVSLGYGRGKQAQSSLDGVFGSVQVGLIEHFNALVEYDSRELRAGVRYLRPLSEQWGLELGASRKLTQRSVQQEWQIGVGLNYALGKRALVESTRKADVPPRAAVTDSAPQASAAPTWTVSTVQVSAPTSVGIAASATGAPTEVLTGSGQTERATALASRMQAAGFTAVSVGFDTSQGWVVQAEPLLWRKNRLDALGKALSVWQKSARPDERVRLVLTHLRDPVLTADTTAACLTRFAEGGWWCDGLPALRIDNGEAARAPALGWAVVPAPSASLDSLDLQFEFGPVLQQRVGTEVALIDASLGLDIAWEARLAPGLLWQGDVTLPLASSGNFDDDKAFGGQRVRRRLESSLVSYQERLGPRLWGRASVGYLQHNDYGAHLEAVWLGADGSLRLGALAGSYMGPQSNGFSTERVSHTMVLGSGRWSVIDGRWLLEAQVGQFYNNDRGLRMASHHWYGDNRVTLHYRDTTFADGGGSRRLKFAGFQFTIPIGNRESTVAGPVTVRGADQWVYGIESKVGSSDNMITPGYGLVPAVRHTLLTDTLDHDRAGVRDMLANMYRVRAMLRE